MKRIIHYLLILTLLISGCATIQGSTFKEQRAYVQQMREDTLAQLFESQPIAKEQIKDAAGYGVFSNIGTNLIFLSTGHGFGIVRDKKSDKDTYMKMGSVGFGIGLGIKDFRGVII